MKVLSMKDILRDNTALGTLLIPLLPLLETPNLVELSVNKPKEVGLEIAGSGYQFQKTEALDYSYWVLLCHVLANQNGVVFHPEHQPRVSTALPGGHRFEAMVGKNVEHALSISIRIKRAISVALEAFGLSGVLKDRILHLVQAGANLVISGGTSSGKTTFLNQLIAYIPEHTRILTLEDTRELMVPHLNRKHYIVSRNEANPALGYSEMIDHLMRSRPDVIIAGEVSISNAFPIVRLLNSGHAGFMCTVHANSPELALSAAIPQNIRLAGLESVGVYELLTQTVDMVLQLHRQSTGQRQVTEVFFPKSPEKIVIEPLLNEEPT
jgi:Flp pilus assembly CpaF family ATPase